MKVPKISRSVWLAIFIAYHFVVQPIVSLATQPNIDDGYVAVIDMDMLILPGTQAFLEKSIARAEKEGAKLLVVKLDTPGGMLQTSQEMIQMLLSAPVPVVIYVSPAGSTATSAGVFITLAGHVAAMTPGTSIGAAHPVAGDGKDIEGDMRQKAEQMTIAMVKSIAEKRGRNVEWAEKSVKDSNSITEKEALKMGVIDVIAEDLPDLLKQLKGLKVDIAGEEVVLEDYSKLPVQEFEISFTDQTVNVMANPNIAALLWLGATTGISLELYNPGAIVPGVVGVICLILALAVSQIIPISQGGLLLLVVGALLIGAEMYMASGVLGIGGIIAIVLGSIYLIDVNQAPNMQVSPELIMPLAAVLAGFLLITVRMAIKTMKQGPTTGVEGMVGVRGTASKNISHKGKVFVNGEHWDAVSEMGLIEEGAEIRVVGLRDGLVLEVEKVNVEENE